MTVVTLLFLTGLFEDLPEATLGALVIAALIDLVDVARAHPALSPLDESTRKIYGVAPRPDFIAAMAAMFGVLIFDTLPGLFIGIAVSLLLLLYRASHPHVAELGRVDGAPDRYADLDRDQDTRQGARCRDRPRRGRSFFANAEGVAAAYRGHAKDPGRPSRRSRRRVDLVRRQHGGQRADEHGAHHW